jgi:glycosyltransferase involved in cell wall biosynthesis
MISKIIWLEDFNTKTHPGGSQLTSKYVMDWGKDLGFDIEECSLYTIEELGISPNHYLREGDLFIMNNMVHLYNKYPRFIREIIKYKKYIRYEHDYMWQHNLVEFPFIKEIFKNAMCVYYLSPLHRKEHYRMGLERADDWYMPSPIDGKLFKIIPGIERVKDSVIYTGGFSIHKGIENILEYARNNPEKNIDLVGWVDHDGVVSNLPDNVHTIDTVKYSKVPELLNSYEYFIHLPNWVEPFGRSVAEALMCGCKMITNENIGMLSYKWNFSNLDWISTTLTNTPSRFWQKTDELMRQNNIPCIVREHL